MKCLRLFLAVVAGVFLSSAPLFADEEERPNFLFIIAEDMSPNLGCYGDPDAITPNLDAFAAGSTRCTRAFSATGVCATSRSAMITGMHPSSIGTQHMRSKITMPDSILPFPALPREAGYFCTNRGKEDYNFDTRPDVEALSEVIESGQGWSRVLALNALDFLGDVAKPAVPLLQQLAKQAETKENLYDRWLSQRILTRFQ